MGSTLLGGGRALCHRRLLSVCDTSCSSVRGLHGLSRLEVVLRRGLLKNGSFIQSASSSSICLVFLVMFLVEFDIFVLLIKSSRVFLF